MRIESWDALWRINWLSFTPSLRTCILPVSKRRQRRWSSNTSTLRRSCTLRRITVWNGADISHSSTVIQAVWRCWPRRPKSLATGKHSGRKYSRASLVKARTCTKSYVTRPPDIIAVAVCWDRLVRSMPTSKLSARGWRSILRRRGVFFLGISCSPMSSCWPCSGQSTPTSWYRTPLCLYCTDTLQR